MRNESTISFSFEAGSYEFENVEVNIYGKVNSFYHQRISVNLLTDRIVDIIGKLIEKFIQMLGNVINTEYDTIDFFGNIEMENDRVISFPIYFVLSGVSYSLYKIDAHNISNILFFMENSSYDVILDRLRELEPEIVEEYFMNEESYEYYNDDTREGYHSDAEGDINEDIYGLIQEDIKGDMYGDIYGIMEGAIKGDMYGDIHGVMNGNIYGDMYGDIHGIMNGNIKGDMHGEVCGIMNGDIEGININIKKIKKYD